MKVQITRPTIAQKRQVNPGEELDVSKEEAINLIGAGKAVAVKDTAIETTDKPMEAVETSAAPSPEEEDKKPKKSAAKKKE